MDQSERVRVKEEAFKDVGGREGFVNVKVNVSGVSGRWKVEEGLQAAGQQGRLRTEA